MNLNFGILENDRLRIEIVDLGAELYRIYDKKEKREILWDGDPALWDRRSPILFPFIGKCFEGSYLYRGEKKEMPMHGFARDLVFKLATATEKEIWYETEGQPDSHENYPFPFCLGIGLRLMENRVKMMWQVENRGEKEMYFMIGGHPGFRIPEAVSLYDMSLKFEDQNHETPNMLHYLAPNERGYEDPAKQGTVQLQDGRYPLQPGFMDQVLTYIFDRKQVGKVTMLLPGDRPFVTVECAGFPYLGVWTKTETAPFLCLEPWYGRCSGDGFTEGVEMREGIIALGAGEGFHADYVIEVH